ncbi:hypothetical protein SKAU_G00255060 [Synaphobranchus kaupii]|uniref:Uncharacterized protein n=1 Tax=Synaphobranchus kaupii TaxID=118154 RepID=A0A9Q1IRB6_SYNKA|nr:hypothetical protein SKAU_G00255060 [Synaphobranchus kaupii]
MGPGYGWAGRHDSTCREVERLPVRGAYCHRSYLVQVLLGDYSKELEPLCCQLLRRRCWQFPTLQNLEVQTRTEGEGEGEGGAVLSLPSWPIPSSGLKREPLPLGVTSISFPTRLFYRQPVPFLSREKEPKLLLLLKRRSCNLSGFKRLPVFLQLSKPTNTVNEVHRNSLNKNHVFLKKKHNLT